MMNAKIRKYTLLVAGLGVGLQSEFWAGGLGAAPGGR